MKTNIHNQLIEYLEGTLPKAEVEALEEQLIQSPDLQRELRELEILLQRMDEVPMEQPSANLYRNFYKMLEAEPGPILKTLHSNNNKRRIIISYKIQRYAAAAVILLAIGLGFGTLWYKNMQQQQQIDALVSEIQNANTTLVLNMLREASASQRIKAVNTAVEQEVADPQVIEALIHTLQHDDNVNVRMKAAEGLAQFARQPEVIKALTQALKIEQSPEVQITLIDILTNLKAHEAKDEFKNLLKKKDV
ncbi:MAG: HEAT repeat domain-containing protein, partial [Saprospiraceae bacterium]